MFYVYVLKSLKDGKRYVGYTNNIDIRLKVHNEGNVRSTQNRRSRVLSYFETYFAKKEAMQREKFFKSGKGRKFYFLLESSQVV